MPPNYKCK